MNKLKLKISTKILDLVEGLPRFRRGTISRLQDIRDHQRESSSEEFLMRKAPKDSSIELSQITLILTFEHEEFSSIIKGLRKYFPKSNRVLEFTDSLRESENRLEAGGWHNLGFISRERRLFFIDSLEDESLPSEIEHVSLSFHRILPSVACLMFELRPASELSKKLNKLQDENYLGNVELTKFWPLGHIGRGYSIGAGSEIAAQSIADAKDAFREKALSWISNSFKWGNRIIGSASYIDVYKVTGNPKDKDTRKDWVNKNSFWLSTYGIETHSFSTLEGDDFLVSTVHHQGNRHAISNVLTRFDSELEYEFADFLQYKVRAVAVSSIIFNVLRKYRVIIEQLRGYGFKNLYTRKKLSKKTQYNIQEIKRALVILSRLEHELINAKHWVAHSISGAGKLTNSLRNESIDLAKNTITNANYQLKQIKDAAAIIDSGLTNYLSVESIYVMYKLQKWMFVLSVVVTIATVIGVLSGWNNIKPFIEEWIS